MRQCSPHTWRTPTPDDDGLACETCGRFLDFMEDITPNMRASIIVAYEDRRGPAHGERFRTAFATAEAAARARWHARRRARLAPWPTTART